jgi:hypothetical protein
MANNWNLKPNPYTVSGKGLISLGYVDIRVQVVRLWIGKEYLAAIWLH